MESIEKILNEMNIQTKKELSSEDEAKLAKHWHEILEDPWLQVMILQGSARLTPFIEKLLEKYPKVSK